MKALLILGFVVAGRLAILHAEDLPSWAASDGRVIQAKFIKIVGESVVLEKAGKQFTVMFAKLAPQSVQQAKDLDGGAVKVSNATVYEVSMTTTFVVPPRNDQIDQVRVYHALPTTMSWSKSDEKWGAENIKFSPKGAQIEYHEPTQSYYALWKLEGQQTPKKRLTFETKMTIKSAERELRSQAVQTSWSDYESGGSKIPRVNSEVAGNIHPELASVAAKIRSGHKPDAAVGQICQWITDNIKYDASVPYASTDVANIVNNKRGHCGHQATVFQQLTASMGIPMRTVFGLNLYAPDGHTNGLQAVRPDFTNIHTWSEVYLPTLGWVEADPGKGADAFAVPAYYVQNNRWFQNYSIWFREGGVDKQPTWKARQGGFDSDYGVENIIVFSSKPASK